MIEVLLVLVVGLLIYLNQNIKSIPNQIKNNKPNFFQNRTPTLLNSNYLQQDAFKIVGIVHSVDPEEYSVYYLYSRKYFRDDSRYQYKVVSSGVTIHINNSEPMEELRTGDTIIIPSKESVGDFTVVLEEKYYINNFFCVG